MNHTQEIREFVISNFLFGDESALQDETPFLSAGIVDSTGILELIMFLEQTYDISVDPDEMIPDNLDSVNKVTRFITRKLAGAAVA